MDSYQSLMGKISVLQKKASALRETEKKRVIAEIRKLIDQYDVQPAEVFSGTKPRVGRPPSASTKGGKPVRAPKPPKYRDPATGKTWNGHGKTPLWLVGVDDRDAYLIDAQAEFAIDAEKPARGARKAKSAASRKPRAAQKRAGRKAEAEPQAIETAAPDAVS